MFEEYRQFVMKKRAPEIGINNWDLLHAALGLSTETLELLIADNQINIQEELGDICWYLTLASHSVYHTPVFWDTDHICSSLQFAEDVEHFVSLVKKDIIYGNAQYFEPSLSKLWRTYQSLLLYLTGSPSPEMIMKINMAKLEARYKDRFTKDEAASRKDKE